MTKSYAQLKSAIAKLEREAAALREAETKKVVAQIKESIATFGLTVEHLFGRGAKALKAVAGKALGDGKAVRKGAGVPKYRHPKTGKTWTGFGKAPGWIATVRNRDKFLIDPSGVVAAPSVDKAVAPVAAVAKKAIRKARTVAAPVKTSRRAKKAAPASVAVSETQAAKPVAKKAAPKKSAPSKKAAPAKKAADSSKTAKAAAKTTRKAAAGATKSQAVAKTRSPRTSTNAVAPVSNSCHARDGCIGELTTPSACPEPCDRPGPVPHAQMPENLRMPHAVSRLRAARLARSAKPFLARGGFKRERCAGCRLVPSHCMCALRPSLPTRAGVCLLMADIEPLKPSNTGWLVADVVADTFAFGWARTETDPALLALLGDPQWQPYVVFPGEYAAPERVVHTVPPPDDASGMRPGKRPLFILLDGTWSEARKMFRRSPYLDHLPGAEPGARAGLAIQAAPLPARRPFLHQRGGRVVPGPGGRTRCRANAGGLPGGVHPPLSAREEPAAHRVGWRGPPAIARVVAGLFDHRFLCAQSMRRSLRELQLVLLPAGAGDDFT